MLQLVDITRDLASTTPNRRLRHLAHGRIAGMKWDIRVLEDQHIIEPHLNESVRLSYGIQASVKFNPVPATRLNVHAGDVVVAVLRAWGTIP